MAGTAERIEKIGVPGSVTALLTENMNDLIDDAAKLLASSVQYAVVGNVGAGVDNLMTYSLPADSLNADGNYVRIQGWGKTASNATAKNLLLKFGAASVLGTLALTASIAGTWYVDAYVFRTGSDTQDFIGTCHEGVGTTLAAGKQAIIFGTATEDEDAAVTIVFQGEGGADNDVTMEAMVVTVGRVSTDITASKLANYAGTAY